MIDWLLSGVLAIMVALYILGFGYVVVDSMRYNYKMNHIDAVNAVSLCMAMNETLVSGTISRHPNHGTVLTAGCTNGLTLKFEYEETKSGN